MDTARLNKFKRRAKLIETTEHLDAILETFPAETRAEVIEHVKADLKPHLQKYIETTP